MPNPENIASALPMRNLMSPGGKLPFLGSLGAGLGGAAAIASVFTKIPQQHVAFREHSGMARRETDSKLPWGKKAGELYSLKRAGWHLKIPFTHSYDNPISLRDHTTEEFLLRRNTSDEPKRQFEVRQSFTWGIVPEKDYEGTKIDYGTPWDELVYRAAYKASTREDLLRAMTGILATNLWEIMPAVDDPQDIKPTDIADRLTERCTEPLLEYGIGLRRYNFLGAEYTVADQQGESQGRALGVFFANRIAELDLLDIARGNRPPVYPVPSQATGA